MKCDEARIKIALYVGGELENDDYEELLKHIQHCSRCAAELDEMKSAKTIVRDAITDDNPADLPSDFSSQVMADVDDIKARVRSKDSVRRIFVFRPAAAFVFAAAAIVVLALALTTDIFKSEDKIADSDPSTVEWGNLKAAFNNCLEGPYDLDSWQPPSEPGVFAVIIKENGDRYRIVYIDESGNLSSFMAYPWYRQRKNDMIVRAGSEDVFVAVCLMPESSKKSRKSIEQDIKDEYKPGFKLKDGA
ncbi:MAG: hypothetical protein GF310_04425 [candidate division Zixibacteria bacterium]|nr:hypothetical protein [candidate division Zixibacteria bacterium]